MSKPNNECYTDNIKVKISERYKPPPRININGNYEQRLSLNKQIQDNMPNYEFSLEKTVLDKMKEWKSIRANVFKDRRDRIAKARTDLVKKTQEVLDKEQVEEVELKTVNETTSDVATSCSQAYVPNNQNYGNYSVNNDILIPTQISNQHNNILTPIPLHNYNSTKPFSNQNDKSPFNISDFEINTSSPFDNMELKSINDMEELAQVLNKDKNSFKVNTPIYSNFTDTRPSPHMQPTYSNYTSNQYSYSIPNQPSTYIQPTTDYSRTNGYYPFQSQYVYPKTAPAKEFYTPQTSGTTLEQKNNCKSVPDIVKALESEIGNTYISSSVPQEFCIQNDRTSESTRPKSTDAVYPRPRIKKEELDNPYPRLTKTQQDLCRNIVSMGFPLSRVARACEIVGDDQKKILDHLLALTELLDLGFSENDISIALVQCDNDREKALDTLIS